MTIKAVLFDMDGVVVDSEPYHIQAMREVLLEEMELDIPSEEIGGFCGLNYEEKIEIIFKKRNLNADIDSLRKKTNERYIQLIKDRIYPKDGLIDLLERLLSENIKISLVTASNRKQTEIIVNRTGTSKYWAFIITGDDVIKRKPDSECYIKAKNKLGLEPKECVVIEDSIPGIEAAKGAGMFCIAIPNDYVKGQDFSKADIIVNSLKEINLDMISNLG